MLSKFCDDEFIFWACFYVFLPSLSFKSSPRNKCVRYLEIVICVFFLIMLCLNFTYIWAYSFYRTLIITFGDCFFKGWKGAFVVFFFFLVWDCTWTVLTRRRRRPCLRRFSSACGFCLSLLKNHLKIIIFKSNNGGRRRKRWRRMRGQ